MCGRAETVTTGQCKNGKCDIWIGGGDFCSQCSQTTDYLNNGKCTNTNTDSACGNTPDSGVCTSCKSGYFLHKGGCYNVDTAPGNLICSAIDTANTAMCKTCAAGYFKNSANVETSDSCIACGDATGVTISGGATYKGVANCAVCTAPQAGDNGGTATCTACVDGKYGADCTGNCNESCKSCNGAEATACTSCKTDNNKEYLKVTDPQARTGECVADETACKGSNTHFLVASTKTCYPCSSVTDEGVADCAACTPSESGGAAKAVTVTCSACTTPTKKPNADGTKCVECTAAGCAKCSDEGVCLECSTGKLTPTGQCVDSCGKLGGYYADGNVCQPCSPECAKCSTVGADKCSTCPADLLHPPVASAAPPSPACGARRLRVARSIMAIWRRRRVSTECWEPFPVLQQDNVGRCWGLRRCSRRWRVRGLSLCGSFSARWQVAGVSLVGFFGWCAAWSLLAHLGSRGGCACCAGVSVRGSRGWAGCLRWLSGGFLGSCPAGGRRFPESRWRPLGVQFMSVSKLCGSLCSGASRVRSGRRAGRWVTGSRPVASDQPSDARWPSRPCTRWQGGPDRELFNVRVELLGAAWTWGGGSRP